MNAWCTAVQAPEPTATSPEAVASPAGSNSGQSITQVNAHAAGSIMSSRRATSMRVAPNNARAVLAEPAEKNTRCRPPASRLIIGGEPALSTLKVPLASSISRAAMVMW